MSERDAGPGLTQTHSWARTGQAVAALQQMLQCSSCCKLLQEPVCLGGCEHVFCCVCVADSLGNGCPVCHAPAWVKDLQPNRQLHNIAHLCSQLQDLLNNKGSPADKSNPATPEMKAESKTGKKWQIRTWFSPRSRKLKCVLDMNAVKKPQKITPCSDINGTPSSVFEFISSPSPPHGSPKKKTSDKSKQGSRKRLIDINKDWGFGKRTIMNIERENDSTGDMDHDRVVSFSSQPLVCSSQRQAVTDDTAEALDHSDTISPVHNVIDSKVESVTKRTADNPSEASNNAATSSCKAISPGQLPQIVDEEHLVPLPKAHASAKRSRKSSDSSSKTPSKKIKKGQSSCLKTSPSCSKNTCDPSRSDTQDQSVTPLRLKSELSEAINETQAISSTDNSCNTSLNRGDDEKTQHATQKSPCTPRSTPKSNLVGSCATTPISPLTPSMKKNHKGETPLHIASIKGDIAAVEQLLENGANPNIKDNAGWTPLHEACNHGHMKVVQLLLQFGVLVNTPGYENDSPLHDAVKNGHVNVVKLLVSHGASQDVINIFGMRPKDYANAEELIAALQQSPEDENPLVEQCFMLSASQRRDGPIMLLGSGLRPADKNKMDKLIKQLKVGSCTEFSSSVTHIIVPNDNAPCTKKCLMGIISGCWLVDLQWVTACLECKGRVSEEAFEINSMTGPKRGRLNRERQLPKLFDGCHFYFMGLFKSCKREDLVQMAKTGGGQILARQPKPDSDVTQSINTVAYHATPGSDQSFCTQYIIYDKDSDYKPKKTRLGKVWTTQSAWLINCAKSFELLPVAEN
ncbi:BRCA1-associated RING domain protein 1 [Amblyraja radiata]|uniref:BRCA1-associated RING domain protein 1 n=1 Tax=Amblyraja radiata TaxID=386614 RepID=UPI001402701F|nr:BRCA1-associated RING domain protein 1 [Amblyraja radiata]